MNTLVTAKDLVKGRMYILHHPSQYPAMETITKKVFAEFNSDGDPLFHDDSMGLVLYKAGWIFYI